MLFCNRSYFYRKRVKRVGGRGGKGGDAWIQKKITKLKEKTRLGKF